MTAASAPAISGPGSDTPDTSKTASANSAGTMANSAARATLSITPAPSADSEPLASSALFGPQ